MGKRMNRDDGERNVKKTLRVDVERFEKGIKKAMTFSGNRS